ncbi:MAG: hypothetical protein AAF340_01430 [Pseudomonadota bacterium]
MSVEAKNDAQTLSARDLSHLKIDGTGDVGCIIKLALTDGPELETQVGEDGVWAFRLIRSAITSLPRLSAATISATNVDGGSAQEEIWIDLETGEIYDHHPAPKEEPDFADCASLTDALAGQMDCAQNPLAPFQVLAIDMRLEGHSNLTLSAQDAHAIEGAAALIIHGDADHMILGSDLQNTGKSESIGDRSYHIYTLGGVDVVIDAQIKIKDRG